LFFFVFWIFGFFLMYHF